MADHAALTPDDVLAGGGWHPGYARVLTVASAGDDGFALVDGNGDGAELEAEAWRWADGRWTGRATSGAGPLDRLGPLQAGGRTGAAHFAFGRAPGRARIRLSFEGRRHEVPVSSLGVWAFVGHPADPETAGWPRIEDGAT